MRVSVQGCLILLLCCFTLAYPTLAAADLINGIKRSVQNCKGSSYDYGDPIATWAAEKQADGYTIAWANEGMNDAGNCWEGSGGACPASHPYYTGDKDQYGQPQCSDNIPDCADGEEYNPDTSQCEIITSEPEECQENGKAFDPQTKQCVNECEHGMFNGTCLLPPEDNSECNSDSPDYRGELVLGYGQSPVPACGDFDQCSGDTPGQVGMVNGELRCIPEDYGVPQCQGDSITVIDEYGFVCEPLENQPEEAPEPPEEPNTDTDGDGEPDEYRRENDPESVDKGLDKINEGVGETNNKLDGTNKRLDKIGKGIDKSNKLQDEANGVADDARNTLKEINDKLDGDEDLDTSGLGDAATFGDTASRLQNAINSHPTIQAVTQIPSVATNNTCPTWTIPGNDYFGPLTIDTHCSIFNDYRGQLSILFILVWTLAAVMIFLRA